jgi:hypothetical protein
LQDGRFGKIEQEHLARSSKGILQDLSSTCKTLVWKDRERESFKSAHIVSVLWFLGYARYNLNLNSKRKCDLFLKLCLDASRAKQLLNLLASFSFFSQFVLECFIIIKLFLVILSNLFNFQSE